MAISVVTRDAALRITARDLQLPSSLNVDGEIPLMMLAQAIRRTAFIMAPCARTALERAVVRSLDAYSTHADDLSARTTEAVDALLAYGDLLEMRPSDADTWTVQSEVIRPSVPTFVMRRNGVAIILGVAGDEIVPFTSLTNARLVWRGVLRHLVPTGGEDLQSFLSDLGLLELSERAWLRLPPVTSPDQTRRYWEGRLGEVPASGAIDGLEVLDHRKSPAYYRGRWTEDLRGLNGVHIGRRPQRYGHSLWCVVRLREGVPDRLIDLRSGSYRERSCDLAWRLQMALDALAGHPQSVTIERTEATATFAFFSPLPAWAERRLLVVGERIAHSGCLFAYAIPLVEFSETKQFLQDNLWLACNESHKQGNNTP